MSQIVGKCSICGGDVVFPSMMVNPKCYCTKCGAVEKPRLPVIPMEQPKDVWTGGPNGDMQIAPR